MTFISQDGNGGTNVSMKPRLFKSILVIVPLIGLGITIIAFLYGKIYDKGQAHIVEAVQAETVMKYGSRIKVCEDSIVVIEKEQAVQGTKINAIQEDVSEIKEDTKTILRKLMQ